MVRRVNHPGFRLLLDNYHVAVENENVAEAVKNAAPFLVHAHIAAPAGRKYPTPEKAHEYIDFLRALREAGYTGGVSIESNFDDEAASNGVAHLLR